MKTRLEQLEALAEKDPNDSFIQYAIALEYVSSSRLEDAAATLEKLMRSHPDYSAGFHQAARVYEQLERVDEARRCYQQGIAVAARQGDFHAQGEMAAALGMLD